MSNRPPDIELGLTHAQATFLLENCLANRHLAMAMIMSIGDEKISVEEKRAKAKNYVELNEQFGEIMKLLMRAGAKRKDEDGTD